jgi:hypothetical protein
MKEEHRKLIEQAKREGIGQIRRTCRAMGLSRIDKLTDDEVWALWWECVAAST